MSNRGRYKLFYIDPINPAQLQVYFLFEAVFLIINVFLFSLFIAMYFPSLAGRMFILVHQNGFFHSHANPYQDIWVILISWWRCYSMAQILTIHFWVSFERQFAMYYITDYEKKSRLWIPALVGFTKASVCAVVSTIWLFQTINWFILCVLGIVFCVIGVVLFFNTYRGAQTLLNVLLKDVNCHHSYTLSLRYQLQENVWCDKLLKHAALGLFIVNLSTVSLFLAANLEMVEARFGEETSQWLDCLFNICVAVDGPIMAIGVIYYNDYLVGVMKTLLSGSGVNEVEAEKDTGHVYFVQLEQQWGEPEAVEKMDKKRRKKGRSRNRQQ